MQSWKLSSLKLQSLKLLDTIKFDVTCQNRE